METSYYAPAIMSYIVGIFVMGLLLGGVGFALFLTVRCFIKAKKDGNTTAILWYAVIILTALIMGASWLMNFGWYRFALTLIPLPLIHIAAFICFNFLAAAKASTQKPLNALIGISCFSFLLTYLAFPDGGDIGGMYVFFGLIKNELAIDISYCVSGIALCVNILIFVLEIIGLLKHKSTK